MPSWTGACGRQPSAVACPVHRVLRNILARSDRVWCCQMDHETIFRGKTYDDFLVRPQQGVVRSRRDIGLTVRLCVSG